jgi:multiple sugar transport system ATP-binding protein
MATITLRNLGQLNLTIHDREFVVLAGPADADCSRIIRLIAGLEQLSNGEILFDDTPIHQLAGKDRDVAFLSHDYTPYPRMTVRQNMALGLERRKFGEKEIEKRITAAAETLGLQEDLSRKADSLSPETIHLVGLARAMVRQPRVYLFGQPFADLPRAARARGRDELVKLYQRSSATIIYATSDPIEALAFDTRTVLLDRDAVQQDATAKAIYDNPINLFTAKFFGDPPMNLVGGVLKQERDAVIFSETGEGTITVRVPDESALEAREMIGKPVVLAIRPESIEIAALSGETNRSESGFRALVDRAEPKGSVTDLYLRTGAHDLICRSCRWAGEEGGGRRLQFEIRLGETHLFDPASGLRVTRKQ